MSIVQAPVTLPVGSTSPTRGSVSAPPYRIINLSVTGTVWIGDNPGITVAGGTPLNPGTSILWTRVGDLWMIADEPGVSVVISYDVEDWQPNPAAIAAAILNSGVLIIDNPVSLLETLDTGVTNNIYGPFDVSRYNSVILRFALQNALGTYPRSIKLVFTEDPTYTATTDLNQLYNVQWEITQPYSLFTQYSATIPIRGKYVFLQLVGAGNQDLDIALTASNRVAEGGANGFGQAIVWGSGAANGRAFTLTDATATIAGPVGPIGTFSVPPWHGEVEFQWSSDARGTSRFQIHYGPGAGFNTLMLVQNTVPGLNNYAADFFGAAFSSGIRRFVMDGRPLRIDVANSEAVAREFAVKVIAIAR